MHRNYLPLFLILFSNIVCIDGHAAEPSKVKLALNNAKFVELIKKVNRQYQQPLAPVYQQVERFAVGEELFLSLNIGKLYLADVYAIKSAQVAQLSLTTLFEVLDFPIEVDTPNGQATGWFINPANQFDLHLPKSPDTRLRVKINDETYFLNDNQYTVTDDNDIYVEAAAISQWLGLELNFDFTNLVLDVNSTQPLPIEQRLARQQRTVMPESASRDAILPWRESGYELFSIPLVDVQLGTTVNSRQDFSQYSILGSHDFAFLNSQFFVAGSTQDSLSDLRLTLSKESIEGDLLGPLHATRMSFGDVTPVNVGIGNTASLSRGLSLTNRKLSQIDDNKRINLSGDIQLGWDVELYQNGILIGQQMSLQNGRYEFNDVDLIFGDNQFEFVFYGPQGQIESKSEQYLITSNAVTKGEGQYSFSVVDVGHSLFDVSSINTPNESGSLMSAVYNHGITDWFSLNAGVSSLWADVGEDQQYFSVGSSLALFDRLLLNGIVQVDQDQHTRLEFNARTRLADTALNASYRMEERANLLDGITQRWQQYIMNMSGQVFRQNNIGLNYQNEWRHVADEQGGKTDLLSNQLSLNSRYIFVSNELNWLNVNRQGQENDSLSGALRLQRSFGPVFARLNALYSVQPESQLDQIGTELYFPLTSTLQSQLELIYFPQFDDYRTRVGLNWQHDLFYLSADADYSKDGDWSVGLNMRFSFGYEPMTEQYFMNRRSMAYSGAMAVRVFEDLNLNGQFDQDEPLIENAKIKSIQNYRRAQTNEEGVAVLSGMTSNLKTDIVLDRNSLEDPFLINTIPGVSITPRAGHISTLDFPVVQSGELEGVVYVATGDGEEQVATYAPISLFDDQQNLVKSAVTEFDGYYLFTDLLPGNYHMSIDNTYLDNKNLRKGKAVEITLASAGEIMNGADFTLEQRQATSGYVVSLGAFNSLKILKAYWQILRTKTIYMADPKPFYFQPEGSDKYELKVAFYPQKAYSNSVCDRFKAKLVRCTVEPFSFDI